MGKVLVQVPIRIGYHGMSYLLETNYEMDFLPNVGELIHPCKFDLDNGLTFEIHKRWWGETGKTTLEIARYVIDPPDDAKFLPRTWLAWWTERDGDLVELLLANGWWHYDTSGGDNG